MERQKQKRKQMTANRFNVVWYFYSMGEIDEINKQKIGENYAKLGIVVEDNILTTPEDIQRIAQSQLWNQTLTNKIAICDLQKEKQLLQEKFKNRDCQDQEWEDWVKPRLIEQLQELFEEYKATIQIYIYKQGEDIGRLIEKSFRQMKGAQVIQKDFMLINDTNWKQVFSFIINFLSSLTDTHISKQIEQFLDPKDYKRDLLQIYEENQKLKLYVNHYLRNLNQKESCQKIEGVVYKIYSSIKANYQRSKQAELSVAWGIVDQKSIQYIDYQIDYFYLQKTFGIYQNSAQSIIASLNSQALINKAIIKVNIPKKREKGSSINISHGFSIKGNRIILNSMNILRLVKRYKRLLWNILREDNLREIRMQKDMQITIFQFQLLQYEDLTKVNANKNKYLQWINLSFKYTINSLQTHQQGQGHKRQYNFFEQGIVKQREVISIHNFSSIETAESMLSKGNLSKNHIEVQSYIFWMKKYVDKIKTSDDIFQKCIRRWEILLELSLAEGLKLQSSKTNYCSYLKEIVLIIQYLSPRLSHQLYKNRSKQVQQQKQQVQQQKEPFWKKFFNCCNKKLEPSQQQQYNSQLKAQLFHKSSEGEKERKLIKIKKQFCVLFISLKKKIAILNRYGVPNPQFNNIKDQINNFQLNTNTIMRMINFGFKVKDKYQIRKKQQSMQGYYNQIKSKWETLSSIKNEAIKQMSYFASSNIITHDQLLDWLRSLPNVKNTESQIEAIQQLFEQQLSQIQQRFEEQALEGIFKTCLKIFKDEISYLQSDLSNNSISILNLLKRVADISYQLRDIESIEYIFNMKFEKQDKSISLFMAETYFQAANSYYDMDQFQKCIQNAKMSLQIYEQLEIDTPHLILSIFFLKIRAQVKILYKNRSNMSQQIKSQVKYVRHQLQSQAIKWRSLMSERFKVYQIEVDLISQIQLKELQDNPNKYYQILASYQNILQARAQFYSQHQASSIMIYIDIIRVHCEVNELQKCGIYYDKITNALESKNISDIKQTNFQWLQNLISFFKVKSSNLQFLQVLPARQHIERCLFEFQEIKKKGKFTIDLKRIYAKVYQIYVIFMQEKLIFFPIKQNLQEQDKKDNNQFKQIQYCKQVDVDSSLNYNKIYWLFFISQKQIEKYEEQIKFLYGQGFIPIAKSESQLKNKIQSIIKHYPQKPIIKLITNMKNFRFISKQALSKLFSNLQTLVVIRNQQNVKEAKQEIRIHFAKQSLQCRIKVIRKLDEIMSDVYGQQQKYEGAYRTYSNVIFFQRSFIEKIHLYHNIVLASLSEEKNFHQQQQFNLLKSQFVRSTGVLQSPKDIQVMNSFRENSFLIRQQRSSIFQNKQQITEKLINICKNIVGNYKQESILYSFVNNTLRSISLDVDFDFKGLERLIYPINRSIDTLYKIQRDKKIIRPGKIIIWRFSEMLQGQFLLFEQLQLKRPFLQFLSFLSTTSSFDWLLQKFCKYYEKKKEFKNCVLFKIQVDITDEFLICPINNGFYMYQNDKEKEIIFNIFNVFQLLEVSRDKTINRIIKQNNFQFANKIQTKSQEFRKAAESLPIRLITLRTINFQSIARKKASEKNLDEKIFQQIQSSFIKKILRHKSQKNSLTKSSFGFIEAYESLGQPKKAVQQIFSRLTSDQSDKGYLFSNNYSNIIIRAAENCLKMGDYEQAKFYITKYLPQFDKQRDRLEEVHDKMKIQNQIFDMKFNLISFFFNQQIDIESYDINIEKIEDQLNQIEYLGENDKKTKEIYLRLHQSISFYEKGAMIQSIEYFENALKQLNQLIQKLKQGEITEGQNIKQYCQKIILWMKERVSIYFSLNKDFQQDILKLSKRLLITSESLHSLSKYNNLQENVVYYEFASQMISNSQFDTVQRQEGTCSEFQILSLTAKQVEKQQSIRLDEPQKTKQKIKQANFHFLAKLQRKKIDINSKSDKGMQNIINRYTKMIKEMINSQIKYLKQEGHTHQSSALIRKYNKIIRQRLNQPNFDYIQLKNQLNKNLFFCTNNQQIKHLQNCRTNLLLAELEYMKTQKSIMIEQHKKIQEFNYFAAENSLENARLSLCNAYNLTEQKDYFCAFNCFNYKFVVSKFQSFESKKHKMIRLSDENLKIHVLDLKIKHAKFLNLKQKDSLKPFVLKSLHQLGNIVKAKKTVFDVLNQEIFVYQMYSIYGLAFTKELNFSYYFKKFKKSLEARQNIKGESNIQNSESCLEIFQWLETKLKLFVTKQDFNIIYKYVQKGTWNCQNNDSFWRFVICKLKRIKHKSEQDQIYSKLNYLNQIFQLFIEAPTSNQLSFLKIRKFYQNFIKSAIVKKKMRLKRFLEMKANIQLNIQANFQRNEILQAHKLSALNKNDYFTYEAEDKMKQGIQFQKVEFMEDTSVVQSLKFQSQRKILKINNKGQIDKKYKKHQQLNIRQNNLQRLSQSSISQINYE